MRVKNLQCPHGELLQFNLLKTNLVYIRLKGRPGPAGDAGPQGEKGARVSNSRIGREGRQCE